MKQSPPTAWNQELASALRFTSDDLEANRHGQLTARQAATIDLKDIIFLKGGVLVKDGNTANAFFFETAIWLGFTAAFAGCGLTGTVNSLGEFGAFLLVMGFMLLGTFHSIFHYVNCRNLLTQDKQNGVVHSITGKLFLNTSHDRWSNNKKVRVEDEIFFIPNEEAWKHLQNLRIYRLYYLSATRLIVSCEIHE